MTSLSRRSFGRVALMLPIGMVVACNGVTGPVVSNAVTLGGQLVADVQGVAAALAKDFPALQSVASSDVWTKVQNLLPTLSSLASSVTTSLTVTAGQPIISQIVGVVEQIAAVAGPFIPPPWGLAVQAVMALIPIIQTAVGLFTATPGAPARLGATMSPAQARQILGIPTV